MAPKKSVFNRFTGLAEGILRWAGSRRSGNAASIPANMFRALENTRFEGQDIICRGGQTKYNISSVLTGCIDGFIPPDYEPPGFKEFVMAVGRDTDTNTDSTNCPIAHVKNGINTLSGVFSDVCAVTWVPGSGVGGAGGYVFIGEGDTDGHDQAMAVYEFDENGDLVAPVVAGLDFTGGSANGNDQAFGGAAKFDGDYYVVVSQNAGGSGQTDILKGDGTLDNQVLGSDADHGYFPMWLVNNNDDYLVAPMEPTVIHYTPVGGPWTTVNMPAGTTANRSDANAGVSFGGGLFFGGTAVGNGNAIFLFLSGTVTQEHQPAGVPPPHQVFCSHQGLLWYVSSASGTSLGHYTNSTFTDNVFTFPGSDPITDLKSSDGKLYAFRGDSVWVSEFPERFWEQIGEDSTNAFHFGLVSQIL